MKEINVDCYLQGGPKDTYVYKIPPSITELLFQECDQNLKPVINHVYKRDGDRNHFDFVSSTPANNPLNTDGGESALKFEEITDPAAG